MGETQERTDWGWPQLPREASAPGRSMFQMPLGALKMDAEAGGGSAPEVAGRGVYPAIACGEPNCHRKISPDAHPVHA